MGFVDAFWKAAIEIDATAAELDEGPRFPDCQKEGLAQVCRDAGIMDTHIQALEIQTQFPDFEALWHPFTLGVGPSPGYVGTLTKEHASALKTHLAVKLGGLARSHCQPEHGRSKQRGQLTGDQNPATNVA